MSKVVLPLSLDTHRNFQAFFKGIEDKTAQDALLNETTTDPAVKQIIQLTRDKKFLKKAENLVQLIKNHHITKHQWSGSFAEFETNKKLDTLNDITKGSEELRDYVNHEYPEGVKLLKEYGKLAQQEKITEEVGAWTDVAAYVEALVNAAAYANVAIATNVAVAAAAVAVIAAVVA